MPTFRLPLLTLLAFSILGRPTSASGETVELVADLNTTPVPSAALNPYGYASLDAERLVFLADDPVTGSELWITDGSQSGTSLVVETEPGDPGRFGVGAIGAPEILDGRAWFRSCDVDRVCQLWQSDGTAAGTVPVTRFSRPDSSGSRDVRALDGVLYFVGADAEAGSELWRSDGTLEGTWRVADLAPGVDDSWISSLAVAGDLVFVVADGGGQLWATDGTEAGTRLVRDFGFGFLREPIVEAGNRIFFQESLINLWSTDGTLAGTRQLVDGEGIDMLGTLGDELVFVSTSFEGGVHRTLRISDGTPEGTRALASGFPVNANIGLESDGVFWFGVGSELWRTDGSPQGTVPLAGIDRTIQTIGVLGGDVLLGSSASIWRFVGDDTVPVSTSIGAYAFTPFRGGFVFSASDSDAGRELGFTDGSEVMLLTDAVDPGSSRPTSLLSRGSTTWFATSDGRVHETRGTDPTTLALGSAGFVPRLEHAGQGIVAFGDVIRSGEEGLPVVFEPPSGAQMFLDSVAPAPHAAIVQIWDLAEGRVDLWGSDGTEAGTQHLFDMGPFFYCGVCSPPSPPPVFSSDADEVGAVTSFEDRVVLTDGTPEGTRLLWETPEDCGGCRIGDVALADDIVYVVVTDSYRPASLWAVDRDGTNERLLENFAGALEGRTLPAPELATLGSALYFTLEDPSSGRELWRSDGTAAGTFLVKDVWPGPGSSSPRGLTTWQGRVWFSADDGLDGRELWSSNGTENGTRLVADLRPGPASSSPQDIVAISDRLVFAADDGIHGLEPWQSDGTLHGTALVADLEPGRTPSAPAGFTESGERVDFSATTSATGRELWTWTPQQTPCVSCLLGDRFDVTVTWFDGYKSGAGRPIPISDEALSFWFFSPDNVELIVKVLDGRAINGHFWVFFNGLTTVDVEVRVEDRETGEVRVFAQDENLCGQFEIEAFADASRELAGTTPPRLTPPIYCGPGPEQLCLHGDRFTVEVEWADPVAGTSGTGTAIPATEESGYFSFFTEGNVELVVKVLDGRDINGRWWVFHSGLTTVEYTLTVSDIGHAQLETYTKPAGETCGEADLEFGRP